MSNKNENRIFLCHASEDKEQVIEVYHKLKIAGFKPWLDKMDLLPGQKWDKEIRSVLKKSRFIIIFFSQHSVSKRGYVQREFKLALETLEEIPEGQIFIIPVRLNNCKIPDEFNHIHYVDLFEKEGWDLVISGINSELGTPNRFTDPRDGKSYKTFKFKGKTWMAENLNFDVGKGCWFYNDNPENGENYGRLYTWRAAKKACPPGWRLPSCDEWEELRWDYGAHKNAYKALIKGGNSGFEALLGGIRHPDGSPNNYLGERGGYWSNTIHSSGLVSGRVCNYAFDGRENALLRSSILKEYGLSCRCIKDSSVTNQTRKWYSSWFE